MHHLAARVLRVADPREWFSLVGKIASEALPADAVALQADQGGSIPTPTLSLLVSRQWPVVSWAVVGTCRLRASTFCI